MEKKMDIERRVYSAEEIQEILGPALHAGLYRNYEICTFIISTIDPPYARVCMKTRNITQKRRD